MDYPKEKIDPTSDYYALEFSADDSGEIYIGGQTHWVGWEDSESRVEMRQFSLMKPGHMADFWTRFEMPFHVVNTTEDFIQWFLLGGYAVVEKNLAGEMLPDSFAPSACVQTGNRGFTSLKRLPVDLFRRAPTPKQRMAIFKRDEHRCRICGRRPDRHVDIELHVHHIRPHASGGATHEDNLITLCHTCHNGLDPHYDRSLFRLLEDTAVDVKTRECRKYLEGVRNYRKARARVFEELQGEGC